MKLTEFLKGIFSFDAVYDEFELLENEKDNPEFPLKENNDTTGKAPTKIAAPGIPTICAQSGVQEGTKLSAPLNQNMELLQGAFDVQTHKDVIFRQLRIGGALNGCVIYMSGMANAKLINEYVLEQLMHKGAMDNIQGDAYDHITQNLISIAEIYERTDAAEVIQDILAGMTILLIDGCERAVSMETRGFDSRSVDKPMNEKTLRGPQEAFVEAIRTNITLLRKTVKTTDFMCEFMPGGGDNNTLVAIAYRKNKANPALVEEVKERVKNISAPFSVGGGMLEQFTEKRKFSILPQVTNTERPDKTSAMIMSGNVAILSEGEPSAIVVPSTLFSMMNSPEDYYMRTMQVGLVRILRLIALFVAMSMPAYYIAFVLYHQSTMSIELINTVMVSRRMVTYPIVLEMMVIYLAFQLVRESGKRVPGIMGSSVSIVAALILGQAAVSANIASSSVLIVVALTGLCNYSIPDMAIQDAVAIISILLIIPAATMGLIGMTIFMTAFWVYLCSVKSFGVPMFAPFAPKTYSNKKPLLRGELDMKRGEDYLNSQEGQ